VLHSLLLCFVVALKTHLGNGFFALTQVLVLEYFCKKSIGIAIANTFLPKYLYWYWQYFWEVLLTSLWCACAYDRRVLHWSNRADWRLVGRVEESRSSSDRVDWAVSGDSSFLSRHQWHAVALYTHILMYEWVSELMNVGESLLMSEWVNEWMSGNPY